MPLFTKANAAILGKQGAMARWHRPKPETVNPPLIPPIADAIPNDLALRLSRAIDETLEKLVKAKTALERAQFARALRDLRETWHLATGKPRAGLMREQAGRQPRREIPRDGIAQGIRQAGNQ